MKQFFRTIKCGLLGAFLLLGFVAPLTFTSCENSHPEINISMEEDYSGIITAINQTNTALADKLAVIESAIKEGTLKSAEALDAIKSAVASMEGTVAEKLAAIETAVNDQTTSFETKMALIETALNEGFADVAEGQDLMKQALESLEGTVEDKLAAVEAAVKDQTLALETKLDLINTTVEEGFASLAEGQDLIVEALNAIDGTLQDKMDALEKAIKAQTTTLAAKLAAIETAVKEGFADEVKALGLIKDAVKAVDGTLKSKLDALKQAVEDQTLELSTKLAAIQQAVEAGFISEVQALGYIQTAIETMDGNLQTKLAAIEQAIKDQTLELKTKLQLIRVALEKGLTDVEGAIDLLTTAVEAIEIPDLETVLGDIKTALTNINDKLGADGAIVFQLAALNNALNGEGGTNTQLASIVAALVGNPEDAEDGGIKGVLEAILDKLGTCSCSSSDYTAILTEISNTLKEILAILKANPESEIFYPEHPSGYLGVWAYVEMGDGLKWAVRNVGSESVTDNGWPIQWGDTKKYTGPSTWDERWDEYKWRDIDFTENDNWNWPSGRNARMYSLKKYTWKDGLIDDFHETTTITRNHDTRWYNENDEFIGDTGDGVEHGSFADYDYEDDPCRVNMGQPWRTPSAKEWLALADPANFTWESTRDYKGSGKEGFIVTSKIEGFAGNYIFLPATFDEVEEGAALWSSDTKPVDVDMLEGSDISSSLNAITLLVWDEENTIFVGLQAEWKIQVYHFRGVAAY